jgi:ATP-binding cassette, subfamily B, bacterial
MPHQMHSPLFYNYRSHKPFTTLFWLIDRPWYYYIYVFVLFAVKHSPELLLLNFTGFAMDGARNGIWVFESPWVVMGVAALILQNVPMNFLFHDNNSRTGRELEVKLRSALTRRLQQLSIGFHSSTQAGKLQTKMLRDVEMVHGLAMTILLWAPYLLVTFAYAVGYTLYNRPSMMLFLGITVPVAVGLNRIFRKFFEKRVHHYRTGVEALGAKIAEMVEMIHITRAHAVEAHEVNNVEQHLATVYTTGRKLDRVHAFFGAVIWVTMELLNFGVFGYMAWLAWKGKITIGNVAVYTGIYGYLKMCVHTVLNFIPAFIQGFESLSSLGEVLECPDIEENDGKMRVDQVNGRITFRDVWFQYPEAEDHAVKNFSIDIHKGECVAFVGESGGGKSTLMSLAIGFHRPTQGHIALDGFDMEELDMRHFRNFIAVVPQRTILFAGSIRQNILYGLDESVTEDQLREAIEAANVATFTDKLPEGLETMLGERGAKLSGGQQQRISIARALIRNPRIIVLDEATSALDVISESLVQEAINRLVANRTTLIVAHRLSTVRKASRIVVMKGGECIELGTPQELLEAGGEFSRLHNLQQMLL